METKAELRARLARAEAEAEELRARAERAEALIEEVRAREEQQQARLSQLEARSNEIEAKLAYLQDRVAELIEIREQVAATREELERIKEENERIVQQHKVHQAQTLQIRAECQEMVSKVQTELDYLHNLFSNTDLTAEQKINVWILRQRHLNGELD